LCNLLSKGLHALSFDHIWSFSKLRTFLANHACLSSHAVVVASEPGTRPGREWQLTGFIPGNARSSCMVFQRSIRPRRAGCYFGRGRHKLTALGSERHGASAYREGFHTSSPVTMLRYQNCVDRNLRTYRAPRAVATPFCMCSNRYSMPISIACYLRRLLVARFRSHNHVLCNDPPMPNHFPGLPHSGLPSTALACRSAGLFNSTNRL
jgi:hypothetical protein